MRPRNLAILALVVVALGAFIWFVERDLPSTEERMARAKLALGVEADEVEALVIERPGEPEVRLERQAAAEEDAGEPGEWLLAGARPDAVAAADADAVDGLVTSLANLERRRTLDGVDEAAMGLDEPRLELTVITADGEARWRVGSAIPASDNMILQRDGAAEALVVPAAVFDDLARPAGEWRSRDLLAAEREEISRVVLERGGEPLVLGRRGEAFWLEAPLVDRADSDAVAELLTELTGLEIDEFLDAPPPVSELGLEPPAAVIEVAHGEAGELFRIELGGPAGDTEPAGDVAPNGVEPTADAGSRWARVGDQVVRIAAGLGAALERSPGDWQAKSWSELDSWQVDRVIVRDGQGELELVRDGGDWLRDGESVPYVPVSDLLYALDSAMGESVVAADELTLGEPAVEIELAGEEAAETLRLYPETAAGWPAGVEGRSWLVMLAPGTASDLELKIAEVRAAEPETADTAPGDDEIP